jgi:hypothetical protein
MHRTLESVSRSEISTRKHTQYIHTMLKIFTLIHLLVNTNIAQDSDGLYTLSTSDGCTYEYACQGEVIAYFEYGVFMYDDNLCECGELK